MHIMKKIEFRTSINASKEKVWDTMLSHGTYEEWVGAAFPESTYEGEWEKGQDIRFFGVDKSGLLATVVDAVPGEKVLLRYKVILLPGGIEDTSEKAQEWIGASENYYFSEIDGLTTVRIETEINPEWESMFTESWPKMLAKLKELCER